MASRIALRPVTALLAFVLAGCPPVYTPGDGATGTSTGTTDGPASTSDEPVDPTSGGTSIGTTTVGPTTGEPGTTGEPDTTGEPGTTGTTDDSSTGSSSTGPADPGLMGEWGHACTSDDECAAILGDKAVCLPDVLGLYELPGGYCSKECSLPDGQTMYEKDDPVCGAEATCIGAMGYFEACAVECTDDRQCPREGYECRVLPVIGMPDDPKFCLMTDEYML